MDHRDPAQGEDQHVPGGAIGQWSVALAATAAYDATAREFAGVNFVVPATLRVTENIRINLNAGYLRALNPGRDLFSYGAGIDFRTPDNVWTVTGELFGVRPRRGRTTSAASCSRAGSLACAIGRSTNSTST